MKPVDLIRLVDRAEEHGGMPAADAGRLRTGIRALARAAATGSALAVPCTTCRAPAGTPCTSILPGGQLTGPHTARIWATHRKASR